jgi:hypothetical protein
MRRALRWRYYCDFCKKAGNSGFHLKRHESSCTLNPDRVCRMCKAFDGWQPGMPDMLALLPDPYVGIKDESSEEADDAVRVAVAAALPALRELCGHCPVCVLSALRQKGIPVPLAEDFNLTAEMKAAWSDLNTEREEREGYGKGLY